MSWIFVGAYIAIHFLLYVFVFRHIQYFWTERGILLFHLLSAVAMPLLLTVFFAWRSTDDGFGLVVGAAAAHGIYSLSFLECWALSEGGYSLRVLNEIVRREVVTPAELEQHFVEMGARKKKGRMDALLNLGLVRADGDRFELTVLGSWIANALALIAILTNIRTRA